MTDAKPLQTTRVARPYTRTWNADAKAADGVYRPDVSQASEPVVQLEPTPLQERGFSPEVRIGGVRISSSMEPCLKRTSSLDQFKMPPDFGINWARAATLAATAAWDRTLDSAERRAGILPIVLDGYCIADRPNS